MNIEPEHLYVIPPNTLMAIRGCRLLLSPRARDRARHLPIDHFMCSLAEDLGSRSIGIILSGGGSDGTIGLEAIKSEGGITFAQDQSARHASMPRSAASTGVVDFVLPPDQIARELAALTSHLGGSTQASSLDNGPALEHILAIVQERCGVDFSHYKLNTVQRRITRRMALHHLSEAEEYLKLVEESGTEAQELFDDLLITVTEFFRDPAAFDALIENVLPEILRNRGPDDPIRVWVPGCSTGKEAYSIAIALSETMEKADRVCPVQLFGTDVSDRSVEAARVGRFGEAEVAGISADRLKRFLCPLRSVTRSAAGSGKCAYFRGRT